MNSLITIKRWIKNFVLDDEIFKSKYELKYVDLKPVDVKKEIIARARIASLVVVFFAVLIIFVMIYRVLDFYNKNGIIKAWFERVKYSSSWRTFGTFILLLLGFLLFTLKRKKQLWYGILETAFAVASSYILTDSIQKTIISNKMSLYILFPIMTTVYLMVRGFSNISDGYNKEKKNNTEKEKTKEQLIEYVS